ncbi:ABC transporter ATP-binding protein [Paenibacillus sp. 1011MAR3C5]|uniref:ABC transporter ATP-binding protein n=1 Tax=Paenibacillus sp. 1011MAR3C5 TaxID=1675787 RepID=UPI000E6D47B8|nr:ABC transporter ATP-binding protein [Paenibacillus sp. 1011MAR3C5]RJE88939.1 ABC transporter ATP-binding protein [Paenibacillus sp. 1011MAR3C5]
MTQASSNNILLDISDVTKSYGNFQALKGISLTMRQGEIISVLGPSGCGKSTLLQLVAGLSQPDDGTIWLGGGIVATAKSLVPPEKRGVNMVFQDYALWPHMSVMDNIEYGLKRMKLGKEEMNARVGELLSLLHLEGLEKRLPPQLSGGQQQRVAIARALATRPKLMLLDEPLSNLDMRLRVEMRTEMACLFRKLGISVFHVTHDPDEAFAMADRLLIMRAGRIDQLDTPEQCFKRPASRWSASLMGAFNTLKGKIIDHTINRSVIQIGNQTLQGIVPTAKSGTNSGHGSKDGLLMFRPEELKPVPMQENSNDDSVNNQLIVHILHCSFEGTKWRAVAETECGQKLYIVHETPLAAGERMAVCLPLQSAYIYRDEDER